MIAQSVLRLSAAQRSQMRVETARWLRGLVRSLAHHGSGEAENNSMRRPPRCVHCCLLERMWEKEKGVSKRR